MIEPRQLVKKMDQMEIHFLVGDEYSESTTNISSIELLAGLAAQSDARLRLALIVVFLQRPDLAELSRQVLGLLNESEKITFKLYYTAAYILQKVYADQLLDVLGPYDELYDYFSDELKIEKYISPTHQLKSLATRHKEITNLPLNWYGTYKFAAQKVISRLKKERAWAAP